MKKRIENQQWYIGIDVSKLTIDVCVMNTQAHEDHHQFENNDQGFKEMELWLERERDFKWSHGLFCMEHTGLYTRELTLFLLQRSANVWMESALHLKRSIGIARGKNDKIDSYRIARYAMTNKDKAILLKLSTQTLVKLKDLMANRERLCRSYQSLKVSAEELIRVDKASGEEVKNLNQVALKGIQQSKLSVEKRMLELISEDEDLKELFDLITSVKCVGNVLATELIVYTHGFTKMTNTRQLACYCGIAPFEHSSGTSIRGRIGTSNFANMKLKSTLHMAAVSATRYSPDMKQYFERKVAEGKSKMTVINAIRNKLIHRIMAVVKRGTPYQEDYSKINLEIS